MSAVLENYLNPARGELQAPKDPHLAWILACLRSSWAPGSMDRLPGGGIDWEQLLALSHRERVSPLIYALSRDGGLLSPDIQEQLGHVYHQSLVRNTYLMNEAENLARQMEEEGIPVLLIKGAGLIETLYHNPALRPMADLDLLVPPGSARRACAVLEAAGYQDSSFEPWPDYNRRYRQVVEFHKAAGGKDAYLIDLHWGILDIPSYGDIPFDQLLNRSHEASQGISVPCPADHWLILCAHLGLHERYAAPLIRYYDLALLLREAGFSWGQVLDQAEGWQLVIPLQRAVNRLGALWPGLVPQDVIQQVSSLEPGSAERRLHRLVVDRQRNPTSDVLFYFATLPGFSRKTRFFLEQAFPSPDYMRRLYCPGHPALWPLAYFLRAGLVFGYLSRALNRA